MTASSWTPVDVSGASPALVFSNVVATIDINDNIATASVSFTFPITTDTNHAKIGGLTTNAASSAYGKAVAPAAPQQINGSAPFHVATAEGADTLIFTLAGDTVPNATLSGVTVNATISYPIS